LAKSTLHISGKQNGRQIPQVQSNKQNPEPPSDMPSHGMAWLAGLRISQSSAFGHVFLPPRHTSLQHGNKETIINRTENVYITLQCGNVCTPFKQCMAKANKCVYYNWNKLYDLCQTWIVWGVANCKK